MRCVLLVLAMAMLAAGPARAADPSIPELDVAAVPYLKPAGRASYADFLLMNVPRALAIASSGVYGWYGGAGSIEDARARAIKSCTDKGGSDCAVYAEDLQVVWQVRPPAALAQPPGPLLATRDHAFVPDARFFWYGPQQARGVLVWGHGKGNGYDGRGQQPQAWVRAFNNAGFDIVRFEREPNADYVNYAAEWLRAGLAMLRQRGWRLVVVGGQSRAAWNSLQILDTPGLADAVIAVSPASFSGLATQEADLSRLLRAARSPNARVAVAQFKGDIFVPDMADRIVTVRERLASRVAATLVIEPPEGITGHGGGNTADFARRFGPCLLRFVTAPVAPKDCATAPGS